MWAEKENVSQLSQQSNDDDGLFAKILAEVFHDHHFVESIERGSGFVKKDVVGIFIHRSGD